MARYSKDLTNIKHDCVIGLPYTGRHNGQSRSIVVVRCPRCSSTRERPASEIRREMKRQNFNGFCRQCALLSVKDGTHRWLNYRRTRRTYKNHISGYVLVSPEECHDSLLPVYRATQQSGQPVLEHRLVMAQHLGRPLTSNECVDHMNGIKTDNRIDNLRLYVRGKQQPGSCPGHGTYYHEWQMAERCIRELQSQLQLHEKASGPGDAL